MAGVEQPLPRIKRCFACNNNDQTYDGRFFTFPKNLHRRIDWFKQLDVPSEIHESLMLTRLYVCAEHFDLANDIRDTPKGKQFIKATTLPNRKLGSNTHLRARYNLEPENLVRRDKFYDFLLEDTHQPAHSHSRSKPTKAPCRCTCCTNIRAEGDRQKLMLPFKVIQTVEIGLQPKASPLPGKNVDSCRLCFATTMLEPLCCGMIVARNEMLDKIYVCTGILIVPRPKVSIFICSPCGQLINSFHTYRQQVCSNNRAMTVHNSWARPVEAPKVRSVTKKIQSAPAIPVLKEPAILGKRPFAVPIRTPPPARTPVSILPMKVDLIPTAESLLGIKLEPEDPLGDCGDPVAPPIPNMTPMTKVVRKIRLPLPIQVKDEPLQMEVTEGSEVLPPQEDLPDQESWTCWHCKETFPFKFECAKHLLQVHQEDVNGITSRLKLDELNSNMLEMMSVHSKKPPPVAKRVKMNNLQQL